MENRKKKLMWVISLLLIAGFLVTSLASYYVSISSVRSQIDTNGLPLTSDNIYSEIQRDILRPIFISSLMANDTFLRDWVIQGEHDEAHIRKYLKSIKTKYNTITSFFVSEKSRVYYHADGILKSVNPDESRDEWYFRVRAMEPDYEINVDADMANKDTMTIFINYKVFDYDGNYIGATGVGLTVYAVKRLIENYQKRYNRNIYFVDKQGDITLYGATFYNEFSNIKKMAALSEIAVSILAGDNNSYTYEKNGKMVHLNTRYIPEFQWILLVEQTEAEAVKNINKALFLNLAICFVVTAIVLFLTNFTISAFQRRLEKMATIDKLTGIYNRQTFEIILREAFKDMQRRDTAFSIILLDIDLFKDVNDTFGHHVGDKVLRSIADIIRGSIRDSDALCRWGGEEFLVLLKDCNIDDAFFMSEKIRKAVNARSINHDGKEIPVTISLGVVQYDEAENEENIVIRADKAMYAAKQKGRDRSEKGMSSEL
ncbi:MAG: sensor domain-containing diguanylate cyclase [Desulfobacterales bacterium]|nr:sensor domain-containing diguanylate cyclase [Desulfobacterales bacterium]